MDIVQWERYQRAYEAAAAAAGAWQAYTAAKAAAESAWDQWHCACQRAAAQWALAQDPNTNEEKTK